MGRAARVLFSHSAEGIPDDLEWDNKLSTRSCPPSEITLFPVFNTYDGLKYVFRYNVVADSQFSGVASTGIIPNFPEPHSISFGASVGDRFFGKS